MTIEDLIQTKYTESDVPQLLITENGVIERIAKEILSNDKIKDSLKKNFKEKDAISTLEEDDGLIEKLVAISENLLHHIIGEIGHYVIDENAGKDDVKSINSYWYLNK